MSSRPEDFVLSSSNIRWDRTNYTANLLYGNAQTSILSYDCFLCNKCGISPSEWNQHQNDQSHKERYTKATQALKEHKDVMQRRSTVKSFEARISRLSYSVWRNELQAMQLSFLMKELSFLMKELNIASSSQLFLKKLQHFEHLERVSLLEQAVWRSVCQMAPNGSSKDPLYYMNWFTEGWKEQKEKMRGLNAISVIITAVLPFLGGNSK